MENVIEDKPHTRKENKLESVNWQPHYRLSKASIGQIMITFESILKKMKAKTELNIYEQTLNSRVIPKMESIVDQFKKILSNSDNDFKKQVIFYNLIVDLPKGVMIDNDKHGKIFLKHANIGGLLEAARQRLSFILEREIPEIYKTDPNLDAAFYCLRVELAIFLNEVIDFEDYFMESIKLAHVAQQNYYSHNDPKRQRR